MRERLRLTHFQRGAEFWLAALNLFSWSTRIRGRDWSAHKHCVPSSRHKTFRAANQTSAPLAAPLIFQNFGFFSGDETFIP